MCDLATLDAATPADEPSCRPARATSSRLRTIFGLVRGPRSLQVRASAATGRAETLPVLIPLAIASPGSRSRDAPRRRATTDVLDVAEFFVRTSERRASRRRAAGVLWDRLPGRWTVRVAEANTAGLGFWDAVVRDHTRGVFTVGNVAGRTQRFRVFSFATAR
jgi:hypothetical protein